MAEKLSALNDELVTFIQNQHIFFVATAAPSGYINLSPKGMDSLRILSPNRLIWLNLTGSGNETAGHLRESNRMTLMFCSFDKQPLILRLYGSASTIHPRDAEWAQYAPQLPQHPGVRQIFIMDIDLAQTSCGFAVPHMAFVSDRQTLRNWADKKGDEGLREYWSERNRQTIDGFDTGILD